MESSIESVESFVARARIWAQTNLPPENDVSLTERELQAAVFDAGFAGIAFPRTYGGAGLTLDHQRAFYEHATIGRRVPRTFSVSIAMLGATLLDHGSERLKRRHIPRILRGDEEWIQLLSEPTGGSDMAGALTRLTLDGDTYVLNGSKMWSSGAKHADYGMCLARTDWDAPKHRGLSMIAVPLRDTPGIEIHAIRQVTGTEGEFCQEFFDDVVLPAGNLIGDENDGWAVAQALLLHERNATAGVGHGYGLGVHRSSERPSGPTSAPTLRRALRDRSTHDQEMLRSVLAESHIERIVARYANERLMIGMKRGAFQGPWGSVLKLHLGVESTLQARAALEIHGADGVIWDGDELVRGNAGEAWLGSRSTAIAGGSNEMQRNIISERLLGLPREPSLDRDIPFRDVLANRPTSDRPLRTADGPP